MLAWIVTQYKRADSIISFGGYISWIFTALGFSGAVLMAWLTSHLAWFWETFSWAGVFFVAILTWLLIGIGLNLFRQERAGGGRALDPWLIGAGVCGIGLAVCLVGYALKTKPATAADGSQATQSTVATSSVESQKPLKRMLTAYDVQQRQIAIDELLKYLNDKVLEVSARGERLNQSLHQRLQAGTAADDLAAYAIDSRETIAGFFRTAHKYDQQFPEIFQIATAQPKWKPEDVPTSAENLKNEIIRIQKLTNNKRLGEGDFQNNQMFNAFRLNMGGYFWDWINERKKALGAKRRELEQAEVYP